MGSGTSATDYDGTTSVSQRVGGLVGLVDSKQGILSMWIRLDGSDGQVMRLMIAGPSPSSPPFFGAIRHFEILRRTDNTIFLFGRGTSSLQIVLQMVSGIALTAGPNWHHLLLSWDQGIVGGQHFYIDDVNRNITPAASQINDVIPWSSGNSVSPTPWDFKVGALNAFGSSVLDGCLSEIYFDVNRFLDFSVVANRRKFISASGVPVELGTNGQLPTGSVPIVYAPDGDTSTNLGVGGSFFNSGTFAACSTIPGPKTARLLIKEVRDELQNCIDANPGDIPLADKLEDAIDKLNTALAELDKVPPDVQAALGSVEGAVGDIQAAVDSGLITAAKGNLLMDDLAESAMLLADQAIIDAINRGGLSTIITEAQDLRNEANGLRASGQFKDAVAKYKDAVAKAESA